MRRLFAWIAGWDRSTRLTLIVCATLILCSYMLTHPARAPFYHFGSSPAIWRIQDDGTVQIWRGGWIKWIPS